ncbi:MAG: M23 family metallopeptidase [Clostridia bacterium]|nr:M23 family metallopeptidase [Clostridia bacterium]
MKKKIIVAVIIALIAVIPAVIAVASYSSAQKNPVSRSSVSKLTVSTPDGKEYAYDKTSGGESDLFSLLFTMNENSKETASVSGNPSDYVCYTASYTSYNRENTFLYYLSGDPENVYYRDNNGKYHKVDASAAGAFLSTKYATSLFPNSKQPVLTVGGQTELLPSSITWKYLSHAGDYLDSIVRISSEVPAINVTGGLQMMFDNEPDYLEVTVRDSSGAPVYEGIYREVPETLFADNTVYTVRATARWYEVPGCQYYGEASYSFTANVLSPAVFYISADNCLMGNFITISAKNIVNPDDIGFVSEPKIYGADGETEFVPQFVEYGGYYHALLPFSIKNEETNGASGVYTISFSYGGRYQDFRITVRARKISPAYLNYSSSIIGTYYSDSVRKDFSSKIAPYLEKKSSNIYWIQDNLINEPCKGKIKYGYGIKMILKNDNNKWFWNEGVHFTSAGGNDIYACMPGEVIFAGETTFSGKMIIIDHGAGLKSVYMHLSDLAKKTGDIVDAGEIIAMMGSTGFVDSKKLEFRLYVFDVPVRYYDDLDDTPDAVMISEEVRKAMGIAD